MFNNDTVSAQTRQENQFTICGFKSPQKVQWVNGRGKSMKLSEILDVMNMSETPRVIEIAVSWNGGHQRTIILNVVKDIHHQYCSFDTANQPILSNDDSNISDEDISDDGDDQKHSNSIPSKPLNSAPITVTYQQCMDRFKYIPIINDHIPKIKQKQNSSNSLQLPPNTKRVSSGNSDLPHNIDFKREKTLTSLGQCLALEELFAILCWKKCPKLAIKIQFADVLTIENATALILKYGEYMQLDSLSSIWYHGVFLHEFPISSNSKHSLKNVFVSAPTLSSKGNQLSFGDYMKNIKKIPSITYSLSWPAEHQSAVKSPSSLKLCLSSILSEISIGNEHDIMIHFPIQFVYDSYYIINDLITNLSYFPYVAFNFFNIFDNFHNFAYNHRHHNAIKKNKKQKKKVKQNEIVCKSDLDWLSNHIHQTFCFTSVCIVRLRDSPNDEFMKILGAHYVKEWSGRLSWNPKSNRPSHQKQAVVGEPSINWRLWQLSRLGFACVCTKANNIGLAKRSSGCLISSRELRPPYRIKGRFFTADKHGVLSVFIRCSSLEYPWNTSNELPAFGIAIFIGNEKLKISTFGSYKVQNKQITHQCGIGATIDNGYNFQIIDRGVMYPIVVQVERTGKDGKGDNFPQGKNLQIPYPKDSNQWMYHVVFTNSSDSWIIIDRLVVDEKNS